MMKKTKIKEIALESIVLAMDEIKKNLEESALNEDVQANAEAMKKLSEAYATIAETR